MCIEVYDLQTPLKHFMQAEFRDFIDVFRKM